MTPFKKSTNNHFTLLLGLFLGILWFAPLFFMILLAIKPSGTTVSSIFNNQYTFNNFVLVMKHPMFIIWLKNSFIVATTHTVVSLLLCSALAFALSKIPFKGKQLLYPLLLLSLLVPGEAIIIPLFKLIINLKLVNNSWGLILPGLTPVVYLFIIKTFFDNIPNDFIEAAKIEGASWFFIWKNIYFPLSRPILVTVAIFMFRDSWNNFLWPLLVISKQELMTISIGLPNFQSSFVLTDITLPMAANILSSLPMLVVFIVFQRQIMSSNISAGIK